MKPQKNVIIACTGSVATIKLPIIIQELLSNNVPYDFNVKVVTTEAAKHFINKADIPSQIPILGDDKEWQAWKTRGDPILHIDLRKWADLLIIAPLSANSLAKIANGLCDNLMLSLVRAWDFGKPLVFCPAMNTHMYEHPITQEHIGKLRSWGFIEIPCIFKTLMCGDSGNGAMAEIPTIIEKVSTCFENN